MSFDPTQFDLVEVPVFAIQADDDGTPVYIAFNRRAQELTGKRAQDVLGKTAAEVFGGRLGQRAVERQRCALQSGSKTVYETSLPLPGGTICGRTTLLPVYGRDGKVIHMVGTSVDITDEQRKRESATMQETMSAELRVLVQEAAEDLQNPISNVQAIANMLREDFVDLGDGKLALIDAMEEVSTMALATIGEILVPSRFSSERGQGATFDLADLCEDILVSLDPQQRHDAFLDQVGIEGDYTAFQIVVRKLFDNAIKFSEAKMLILEVSARSSGDDMVAVRVKASGKGLQDPRAVFEGQAGSDSDQGIGLAGVRRLVQSRGGTMTMLETGAEEGAVIEFTLPGCLLRAYDGAASTLVG